MSYYRMHRGWMESEVFGKEPFSRHAAWVWLIENAAWRPETRLIDRQEVHINRGEMSFRVHRFLVDLTTFGMISRREFPRTEDEPKTEPYTEPKANRPQNILTICNYEEYQSAKTATEPKHEPYLNRASFENRTKEERKKEVIYSDTSDEVSAETAPDPVRQIFGEGLTLLTAAGIQPMRARSLIGGWRKRHTDAAVLSAIVSARERGASNPVEYVIACLNHAGVAVNGHKPTPGEKLFEGFARAAEAYGGTRGALAEPLLDGRRSPGDAPGSSRGLARRSH
jgi:hypothetical protein